MKITKEDGAIKLDFEEDGVVYLYEYEAHTLLDYLLHDKHMTAIHDNFSAFDNNEEGAEELCNMWEYRLRKSSDEEDALAIAYDEYKENYEI